MESDGAAKVFDAVVARLLELGYGPGPNGRQSPSGRGSCSTAGGGSQRNRWMSVVTKPVVIGSIPSLFACSTST
jgi:hypothetical protein